MTTTWNSADKGSNITLSNGDRTAVTTSSARALVRSIQSWPGGSGSQKATNILYFEVDVSGTIGAGAPSIGISNTGEPTNDNPGFSFQSVGYFPWGAVVQDGATFATYGTYDAGATIGIVLRMSSQPANGGTGSRGRLWFTLNGTTFNNDTLSNQDPFNDIGGYMADYPLTGIYNGGIFGDAVTFGWFDVYATVGAVSNGATFTARFGNSDTFTYTSLFGSLCAIGGTAWDGSTNSGTLSPTGIAAIDALGTPTLSGGNAVLSPSGIPAADALGTPTVTGGNLILSPGGIAAADALGTAHISLGTQTLLPSGIPAADALGTPTFGRVISDPGINAGIVLHAPLVTTGGGLTPAGIASGAAIGTATITARTPPNPPFFHGPFV